MKHLFFVLILITTLHVQAQKNDCTKILFIRHAEVQDDGTDDPKLSEAGLQRAKKWADILADVKIDKVYSTVLKRTQSVAWTIAHEKGLKEVISYKPDMDTDAFLFHNAGKTILIVGHSNTTPALINKFIGAQKFSEIDSNDFGKLFVVSLCGKASDVTVLNFN